MLQLQNSLAAPLASLINKSIEDEVVPDSLKIAKVTPIFKSKDDVKMTTITRHLES